MRTRKAVGGLLLAVSLGLALQAPQAQAATPVAGHRIVLDPGHGGNDPGSTECAALPEKTATLQIALRLRELLKDGGALEVYLTREDDSTKSNNDRYTYANSVNGEALVSIHLNGSTDHTKDGTLGLWGKKGKDQAFAQKLHSRLATELSVPDLGLTVPDLGLTNYASGVLLKSNMPASIQETVFISNTTECKSLKDATGWRQQQIAQSLYNGLADWFTK